MKTLNQLIEEEINEIYVNHLEDLMRQADLAVRCEVKDKEKYYETLRNGSRQLLDAFRQSLTNIAKATVKNGKGMVREEAEVYLNKKTFEHYWGKTENKRVSKLRHIINMHGLKVAIDFYRGNLSGLIIAEIEFKTESEAKNFNSFSWLGKDVTEDEDFKNNNLACYGLPEKFSLHNKKQP